MRIYYHFLLQTALKNKVDVSVYYEEVRGKVWYNYRALKQHLINKGFLILKGDKKGIKGVEYESIIIDEVAELTQEQIEYIGGKINPLNVVKDVVTVEGKWIIKNNEVKNV
jgi:hypothetical protein